MQTGADQEDFEPNVVHMQGPPSEFSEFDVKYDIGFS